jgi:hypothetical protein
MIKLILLIILFVILIKKIYNLLPETKIQFEDQDNKISLTINHDYLHTFNILPQELYIQLNDSITEIDIFKNYNLELKSITNNYTINKNVLIYIPYNTIKWHDQSYFYDRVNNTYYFPKPNSILYSKNELIYYGKDIHIYL